MQKRNTTPEAPMENSTAKRRRSDEGLLGLLGAYGSEEEEEINAASPSEAAYQALGQSTR